MCVNRELTPDFLLNAWTDSDEILRVYSVHSQHSWDICINFGLFVPCWNILLMEHIWRDREILVTSSEVSTGSQKCPHAVKKDELYVPSKFHPNRITCLGGDRFTHIKKTGSKFSDILPARDQDRFCRNHHKHRFDHLQHNLGYQFLGGPIFLCKLDSWSLVVSSRLKRKILFRSTAWIIIDVLRWRVVYFGHL